MSKRHTINYNAQPIYDIVIKQDFSGLPGEINNLELTGRKFCIVTDSTVAPLYLEQVKSLLANQVGNVF